MDALLNGFITKDGLPIAVPVEGSLGLLAIGDVGLLAWRSKLKQHMAQAAQQLPSDKSQPQS